MGHLMNSDEQQYINQLRRAHQWKMAFFGLLFLIIGIIIGAGSGVLILGRRSPAPDRPDQYIRSVSRRMARELNLTEPQAQEIHRVVQEHLRNLDEIRRQTRPQIEAELAAMNLQIMEVLNPEQQQIWREKARQLRRRITQPEERPSPYGGRQDPGYRRQGRGILGPRPGQNFNPRSPRRPLPPQPQPVPPTEMRPPEPPPLPLPAEPNT